MKKNVETSPFVMIDEQYEFIEKVKKINNEKNLKTGKPVYCFTHTYGCQQNENDTEKLNGLLIEMGYTLTDDKTFAEFILFNTCAVREHAEQKVFGNVGALVHYKRRNPELKIALCGCMMQQKHIAEKLSGYKYIDLIFGTHALDRFPQNMYKMLTSKTKVIDTEERDTYPLENVPIRREGRLKAWVTVMSGCNNYCSYCVVPYVRGREHSRLPENVINEVKQLISEGYKEITLLGQNVNSYCKDLDLNYDFSDLLRDINDLDGDFRLRFMTSHPKDATKKLFDTIAECEKVCHHIHLPFQSGSDRVLKLMNRKYTAKQYLDTINYAKEKIPDASFTSDVIVGFPTETEDDFEDTLKLVSEVTFNGLYTFIYSPRKNTPAAEMEGQVSKEDKSRRFQKLLDLQNKNAKKNNSKYIGEIVRVLVDDYTDETKCMMTGRTDNNIIVNFPADESVMHSYANIRIDRALNWAMFGIIEK